jgi:hypothetical protein
MGMDKEADPLPAPMLAATSSADHTVWIVPDWQAPVGDVANARVGSSHDVRITS